MKMGAARFRARKKKGVGVWKGIGGASSPPQTLLRVGDLLDLGNISRGTRSVGGHLRAIRLVEEIVSPALRVLARKNVS